MRGLVLPLLEPKDGIEPPTYALDADDISDAVPLRGVQLESATYPAAGFMAVASAWNASAPMFPGLTAAWRGFAFQNAMR